MNCETDWPTLIEANDIKPLKKKHNGKKKSSWIKINSDVRFNKVAADNVNANNNASERTLQQNSNNGKMTASCINGIKSKFLSKIIRPFNHRNDVYNFVIDSSLLDNKQKTFCRKFPLELNTTTTINDIRIDEMYAEFLNDYFSYMTSISQLCNLQNGSQDDSSKSDIGSKTFNIDVDATKNNTNKVIDDEIMLVRANVLSYYFSESNLCHDNYLISMMDNNGWVDIDSLLKFPRLLKTKTSIKDVSIISKKIRYPRFESCIENNESSLPDAVLEISLGNDSKIRRSDMDNFRSRLLAFNNAEKYVSHPYYSPYPDYTYRYFINSIEEKFSNIMLKDNRQGSHTDEDWTEVKPKSRRSRRSECKNDSHNAINNNSHDYLDFEFSSEPTPLKALCSSNLKRRQASRKSAERSRSRTISCGSEDELDESNIYIVSLRHNMLSPKITNWADVSDSDEDMDIQIQQSSNTKSPNISHRLLAKHPSGDRHPNPDYQPKSKIQEQLREIIFDGLHEWKSSTEVIRRNRKDSSSSTSSDIKVTICQDEKAFKLMQKSLQNHDCTEDSDVPVLPTIVIPIEKKVEVMKQKHVNVFKFKPLVNDIDGVDYDFLLEASTSSLLNPVHYDSWNPPFLINQSLSETLDKLLADVKYEYITTRRSEKSENNKEKCNKENDERIVPSPTPVVDNIEGTKTKIDVNKEIRKTTRSCKVGFYPVTKIGPSKNKQKDKTRASDHPIEEFDIGYAYEGRRSSKRHRTISGNYSQYNDAGYAVAHGIPIPFNDHPSQLLLKQNGFEIKFYKVFRKDSLADREKKGIGRSQEMNTLFRFWSFFLRENKNKTMYQEFQKYAWEDAAKGYRYGVECLFRMYTYKLEQKRYFSEEQYQDFQKHVLKDYENGRLYGLEKFWALIKYSGRQKLDVNAKIRSLLEKFKTLEDFRINFIPPQGFHSYKLENPSEHGAVESGIESE